MTTPSSPEFRFEAVMPGDVGLEDVRWLDLGLRADVAKGEELGRMLEAIASGRAILWRFTGPEARGVLLTKTFGQNSELHVWLVAGRGLISHTGTLVGCLDRVARANGLRFLTSISNLGMKRILERRGGFAVEGYAMRREVPRG